MLDRGNFDTVFHDGSFQFAKLFGEGRIGPGEKFSALLFEPVWRGSGGARRRVQPNSALPDGHGSHKLASRHSALRLRLKAGGPRHVCRLADLGDATIPMVASPDCAASYAAHVRQTCWRPIEPALADADASVGESERPKGRLTLWTSRETRA